VCPVLVDSLYIYIYIQGVPKKIVHKRNKGHRVKPALGAYSTRNSKMFSLWALLETISFSRWKWPLKFEKIGGHISTQKISRVIIRSMPYSTLKIMNISLRASLCSCLFRWWKSQFSFFFNKKYTFLMRTLNMSEIQ